MFSSTLILYCLINSNLIQLLIKTLISHESSTFKTQTVTIIRLSIIRIHIFIGDIKFITR